MIFKMGNKTVVFKNKKRPNSFRRKMKTNASKDSSKNSSPECSYRSFRNTSNDFNVFPVGASTPESSAEFSKGRATDSKNRLSVGLSTFIRKRQTIAHYA